jgi:hypothetical protein
MALAATDRNFERCPACGTQIDMTDPRQVALHAAPGHEAITPPVPGLDRGGLIEDNEHAEEIGWFETCKACCQTYDRRKPAEVSHHETPGHRPLLPVA